MTKLDSISLFIPNTAIGKIKNEKSYSKYFYEQKGIKTLKYSFIPGQDIDLTGIKRIQKEAAGIILELSSKILRDDYLELISLKTIEKVELALSEYFYFRPGAFLSKSEVMTCDVTKNLSMPRSVSYYLSALGCICNEKYPPQTKDKGTVSFSSRFKSVKERITFYDKKPEMLRAKNKRFLASLDAPDKILSILNHQNILRAERNLKTFKAIRTAFDTDNRRLLINVLSSNKNPLQELFWKIRDHKPPTVLQANPANYPRFSTELKLEGMRHLAHKFLLSPQQLFHYIRSRASKQLAPDYIHQARSTLETIKAEKLTPPRNVLLSEIEIALEAD